MTEQQQITELSQKIQQLAAALGEVVDALSADPCALGFSIHDNLVRAEEWLTLVRCGRE